MTVAQRQLKEDDPRVRKISGHSKPGVLITFRITHVPLPRTEQLAFLVGLILGDGRIEKFPRSQRLRIVLGTDKPLLWKRAAEVVQNVFAKKPWAQKRKGAAAVDISLYQTRLIERLGIPTGNRGKLIVRLPERIQSEHRHLIACLKGLFEAEGSCSVHAPTHTYNLSFSNRNPALLNEVERALTSRGFHPERRSYAVRLRKKRETARFIELIRFRSYNA